MEPHLKVLETKTKEVYKDGIALKNQMGAAEKMMYKQQKSNTSQILLQEVFDDYYKLTLLNYSFIFPILY
jgi:hypothetical protein